MPADDLEQLLGLRGGGIGQPRHGRIVRVTVYVNGLWLIAGHGPWGISTGPGSARLLVELMRGGGRDPIPAALAVDRLG